MVGVISASNKTPLTIGMSSREMHPVLLSIANIELSMHMKATSSSFVLTAYLPILKFINDTAPVQAALAAQVYHLCLNIVTENLQHATCDGVNLTHPQCHVCICYTPLVL